MKISTTSWHYKLYVFNTQLVEAWKGNSYFHTCPSDGNVGLCPYMRMIMIWGPLVLLTYTIPIGMTIAALVLFPMKAAGVIGILYLIGWIVGLIAVMFLMAWLSSRKEQRELDKAERTKGVSMPDVEPKTTFWSVLKEYIIAAKTKVCPVLEVSDD